MVTLNRQAKDEMCRDLPQTKMEALVCLSALFRASGLLGKINGNITMSLSTENSKFISFVDKLCTMADVKKPLREGNKRRQLVFTACGDLLRLTGIFTGDFHYTDCPGPKFIKTEGEKKFFVKGYFLGSGFVSSGRNSHLEIAFSGDRIKDYSMDMLSSAGFSFSESVRDGRIILYMKSKDRISDFLTYTGAPVCALNVINEIVEGEVKKKTMAAQNCDMANINKTVAYAAASADAIKKIDKYIGLDKIDEKLRTTAYLRLGYMEEPLNDLALRLGVSKSCVKHRLDRLIAIASQIKQ